MSAPEPSRDQVLAWLQAVQRDLDKLQDHLSPLLEEQRRLEGRQALLKDLLSSFEAPIKPSSEDGARPWSVSLQPTGNVGDYVRDRAREVLLDAGEPLHINDIHAEFVRRGFPIPGAGKPVNLIVHLRSGTGIASPARGMYALGEQVAASPVQRRNAKRRKRTRSPARRKV